MGWAIFKRPNPKGIDPFYYRCVKIRAVGKRE
nr:MAG TPA: hypothetical protein [Caudoviricetes sp.]